MQYEVEIRCVTTQIVVCEGCTKEQAEENPWNYSVSEHETNICDWDVLSIKEKP